MVALPEVAAVDTRSAALDRAVVETLAYSDVFDYPLTADEVWRGLPASASRDEVAGAIEASDLVDAINLDGRRYFALEGRASLGAVRLRRRRASAALWREARRYGAMIARLPYVRMVAVTGALAFDNSETRDDIDYLIVTRPGRVWLVRAMTMAVVRLAALRGVTLCPNYLLAEDVLELPDRDLYAARELMQMTPLSGRATHARMMAVNGWWRERLPNATPASCSGCREAPLASRLLERLIPSRLADAVDRRVFARKGAELRTLATSGGEAVFDRGRCKGHFEGHRARTEAAVARRLEGLEAMA